MSSEMREISYMSPKVIDGLEILRGKPSSAAIELKGEKLLHLRTNRKIKNGTAISVEDIKNLPKIIANPLVVLDDTEKKNLLYAFEAKDKDQMGKVVVEVDIEETIMHNGIRIKRLLNEIISAGLVPVANLKNQPHYIPIPQSGSLWHTW